MLLSAAVVPVATLLPAAARAAPHNKAAHSGTAEADAAILAAYDEWRRLYELSSEDDGEHYYDALNSSEIALMKLPPETARGLAIQAVVFTYFGEYGEMQNGLFDFGEKLEQIAGIQPPSSFIRFVPLSQTSRPGEVV